MIVYIFKPGAVATDNYYISEIFEPRLQVTSWVVVTTHVALRKLPCSVLNVNRSWHCLLCTATQHTLCCISSATQHTLCCNVTLQMHWSALLVRLTPGCFWIQSCHLIFVSGLNMQFAIQPNPWYVWHLYHYLINRCWYCADECVCVYLFFFLKFTTKTDYDVEQAFREVPMRILLWYAA